MPKVVVHYIKALPTCTSFSFGTSSNWAICSKPPRCQSRSSSAMRGFTSKGTSDKGRKAQSTSGSTKSARTMEKT